MWIRLTSKQAEYLKDQLDMWIEGYKDVITDDDEFEDPIPTEVVEEMLRNRETAERIRNKVWRRII